MAVKTTTKEMSLKFGSILLWCHLLTLILMTLPSQSKAQGSIFGQVRRSDSSIPPDNALLFFGFVAGTDSEIRVSGSVGAEYDGGNWSDDFQNFLYSPPGEDYVYLFFDTLAGETGKLNAIIPNNSFQQENIALSPGSWPLISNDFAVSRQKDGLVLLRWAPADSLRIHVFRRAIISNGSYFRIDDLTGDLLTGVTTGQFIDSSAIYETGYSYLLLAINPTGQFSPPLVRADAIANCCGQYTNGYTGNVNGDPLGKRNLADIVRLIDRVYLSKVPLSCERSGNIDGDAQGAMNIVDITRLIDQVFGSKQETAPCAP